MGTHVFGFFDKKYTFCDMVRYVRDSLNLHHGERFVASGSTKLVQVPVIGE